MKTQRFLIAMTFLNFTFLLVVVFFISSAFKSGVSSVVRANSFEIIDEHGKVRAEIKILPADPGFKMPDGSTGSPETVIFRLIDSDGNPNVKISAVADGSGLVLGGESGYIQILSRTNPPFVRLKNKSGKEELISIQ